MSKFCKVFDIVLSVSILIAAAVYFWRNDDHRRQRNKACKCKHYLNRNIDGKHKTHQSRENIELDLRVEEDDSDLSLEDELLYESRGFGSENTFVLAGRPLPSSADAVVPTGETAEPLPPLDWPPPPPPPEAEI